MNNMKLIMENWRRYSIQEENNYGSLYLFENDSIRETSFYERFNSLQESEGDLDVFLEEWEKSVDYMLESLNEQTGVKAIDDVILRTSVQAYMALQKGGQAVGRVLGVAKKLKAALEKKKKENPKLAKVGMFALDALVVGAVAVGVAAIIKSGADPSDVMSLANDVKDIAPDVAQSVADVAKNFNAETAADLVSGNEDQLSQAVEQLSQVDNEAVQQIAQQAEKVADIIPEDPRETFEEMWTQQLQDPDWEATRDAEVASGRSGAETAEFTQAAKDAAYAAETADAADKAQSAEAALGEMATAIIDTGRDMSKSPKGLSFNPSGGLLFDVPNATKLFAELSPDDVATFLGRLEDLASDPEALTRVGIDLGDQKKLMKVLKRAHRLYITKA
jgi:hypothetical protein